MIYTIGGCEISVRDEPTYSVNSTGNPRSYKYEYRRTEKYEHSSAYGVVVRAQNTIISSSILLGVGGVTGVNKNSVAYDGNSLYVASGDALFALSYPALKLLWFRKVDFATCFGVYWLKEHNCLVTWGELNICRLTPEGKEVWSASGPDIFTEDFEFVDNQIKVTLFQ